MTGLFHYYLCHWCLTLYHWLRICHRPMSNKDPEASRMTCEKEDANIITLACKVFLTHEHEIFRGNIFQDANNTIDGIILFYLVEQFWII